MEKPSVLRDLTNLSISENQKESRDPSPTLATLENTPSIEKLIKISHQQLDFGYCIPGSIHEKLFSINVKQQLQEFTDLIFFIVCQDQILFDTASIIFGIKKIGQEEFYDEYRIKIKSKNQYEFKIRVTTPMHFQYDAQNLLYILCKGYSPIVIKLKQRIQIPEIICLKELFIADERVIKLSIIQNRSKKQCKVPFKLNHSMTISITAEVIGLFQQLSPLIDVKPRVMTLAGKGQFSLIFTINVDSQIKQIFQYGLTKVVRRILILKIKDTKFLYHFPIEVTYCPEISMNIIAQLC